MEIEVLSGELENYSPRNTATEGGPVVRDLMTRDVFSLFAYNSVSVLEDLLSWKRIRHVPVVNEDNEVVGLVTHRDFLKAAVSQLIEVDRGRLRAIYDRMSVADIMQTDVITVSPDLGLSQAARLMFENKYGCLPVVEEGRLVGIVTEADFVRTFFQWDIEFDNEPSP